MTENLTELLSTLAEKLGTKSEKVYEIMMKQVKIDYIKSVAGLFLLLIFFIPVVIYWQHLIPLCVNTNPKAVYSFEKEYPVEIIVQTAALGVATLFLIGGTIAQLCQTFNSWVAYKFNPEAEALQKIFRALK